MERVCKFLKEAETSVNSLSGILLGKSLLSSVITASTTAVLVPFLPIRQSQ